MGPNPQPFHSGENLGQPFLFPGITYVYSRAPSPCSRFCICTCMSLACCSRWQSCCSGSGLKSTHPRLKDNRNMKTLSDRAEGRKPFRHNSRISQANCADEGKLEVYLTEVLYVFMNTPAKSLWGTIREKS